MFNSREFFEKEMGKKWVDYLNMPKYEHVNSEWFRIVGNIMIDIQEHNFGKALYGFSLIMSGKQLFHLLDRYVEEGATTYDTWVNIGKVVCKQYLPTDDFNLDKVWEESQRTAKQMCDSINEGLKQVS